MRGEVGNKIGELINFIEVMDFENDTLGGFRDEST